MGRDAAGYGSFGDRALPWAIALGGRSVFDVAEAVVSVASIHADEFRFRQALEKLAPVAFLENARVEDSDNAFVVFFANEASDALAKFNERFGEGEVRKGIAAVFLDPFGFGFGYRMGRDVEGEAGDDYLG